MMQKLKPWLPAALALVAVAAIFLRFYRISANQFLFYDEGMYLGYNRAFLDLVANNPPHDIHEFFIIAGLMLKAALSTAKALWFFILNLRVFILGPKAWFFARWISAVSGLTTVVVLYFWARRFLNSPRLALISAFILLILPSHVFYSRLGMQESLSTLLFLSGIYLFMRNERMGFSFFMSVFLLACVYFTNYRMIIGPTFIAFIEGFRAASQPKKFNWLRVWLYIGCFYVFVLLAGSLYGGINNYVNFAWMTHQAKDAGGEFNLINFLSYPYYVFALEGFFFALFFWGNLYLVKLRQYQKLLPFGLVVFQMIGFSFAAEKGARYLCVVLPFMAAAAAVALDEAWQRWPKWRAAVAACAIFAVAGMIYLSASLAMATTDYEAAIRFVTDRDPHAVIVTTQPLVEGLYVDNDKMVLPCPKDAYSLFSLYSQGARYLVLDPQAYISWTKDGRRFSPPLIDILEYARRSKPLAEFPHLNKILLKRFVLDHNEQLLDSLKFLSHAGERQYGKLRIYDLNSLFSAYNKKI